MTTCRVVVGALGSLNTVLRCSQTSRERSLGETLSSGRNMSGGQDIFLSGGHSTSFTLGAPAALRRRSAPRRLEPERDPRPRRPPRSSAARGQVLENVAALVDLAALEQGERSRHG